jgi:voltage-gated potassium channel
MGPLRRWLQLAVPCGCLVGLYFLVPATPGIPTQDVVLRAAVALLVLVLLAGLVTRQLRLQIDEGVERRVDGLVFSVVLVVVAFSMSFYLLNQRNPTQVVGLHTRLDALYFTMTTMTTVGFGDVYASGQAARGLVVVEMLFNVVFVASAAALLSGRVREAAQQRSAARRTSGPGPDQAASER